MVTAAIENTDAHELCSGSGHLSWTPQDELLYLVPDGLPQTLYNISVDICCKYGLSLEVEGDDC